MSNKYQAENIKSLDYFEHIRKYPGMYIGSKNEQGLLHCVKEIISNSIDEFLNGAGTIIKVELLKNDGIRISDNGRGIPHGKHSSGCSILHACFGIANTASICSMTGPISCDFGHLMRMSSSKATVLSGVLA